jgi:iron complex outermembrane recepter protein
VLYGQSEPAGIINKVTKKPTATPLRQVELQAGNFDRYQGSVDLGGPANDEATVLYRVIGLVRDSESQYKYNNSHRSKDDREVFAPSITLKPTDKTTLTLQLDYLHAQTGVPFTTGTATSITHTMLGDYTYDKNERTQLTYGYLFEHIFNDQFTVRQNLRVSDVDFQYRRMGIDSVVGTTAARNRSIIDEKLKGVALDNQAQFKFDTGTIKHTTLAGIDFQRSSYTNQDGDAGPATANDLLDLSNPVYGLEFSNPAYTSKNYQSIRQLGFYLQDQIKFDDHLVATLSARKDLSDINTENKLTGTKRNQDDEKFTYRVGVAYVFDSGFAPYITHATSFNPAVGVDVSGSALKPTTGKLNEIGLRYIPPGRNDSYTLSAYELTQRDVVVYNSVTFDAVQAGEIRSRGVEFEVKTNLLPDLNLITALTLQDVEITKTGNNIGLGNKGDSPIYVPKKALSTWLDYKFSSGALAGLGIAGGVRYTGHSNGGDPWGGVTYENESYTVFDAAINYTKDQWRFGLNINNLFDKQYTICGYSGCTWGYERTAIATARYTF